MQDRRFRNLENVERVKILSARRATDLDPDFDEFLLCLSPFSLVAPSLDGKHSWKKLVGASNSRSSFRLDESRRNVDSPAKLPRVQFAETARAKNRSISIGVDAE